MTRSHSDLLLWSITGLLAMALVAVSVVFTMRAGIPDLVQVKLAERQEEAASRENPHAPLQATSPAPLSSSPGTLFLHRR